MLKLVAIILACISYTCTAKAQDSVIYNNDLRLYEGLYLNYQDLRYNWPIPKEKIITKISKDQLDFYSKLVEEQEEIEYIERDSSIRKIRSEDLFGYCQNNVIFVSYDKSFYRIPVFGNISYFLGSVSVQSYNGNLAMNAPMTSTNFKPREIKEFLLDFYSGEMTLFSVEQAEEYLKRDAEIYKGYSALSKKNKKSQVAKYIRLYNEKHPVYFPKG